MIHDTEITPIAATSLENGRRWTRALARKTATAQEVHFLLPGAIDCWWAYSDSQANILCIEGSVKLVLFDGRTDSPDYGALQEIFAGEYNPVCVTLPAGVYLGWQCQSGKSAIILLEHDADPQHLLRHPGSSDLIPYRW